MAQILWSARPFVPLDLAHWPPERCRAVLKISGASLALAHRPQLDQLRCLAPELAVQCYEDLALHGAALEPPLLEPADLCYAIFTSGSTGGKGCQRVRLKQLRGRPKCVLCEHQAALGYALGKAQVEELGVGKRQLLASHFTFDPAEGDVFGALCAGATLLAPRRPQVLSELQEVLHSMQASHATMTPSQWALKAPGELPHLKHLRLTSRASHGSGSIQLLKPLKFIET